MLAAARPAARYRTSWMLGVPFPIRNVLRRWRELIGMMLGVGIALGIVMTLSGIGRAVIEVYTIDYQRSGVDLYVVTQGGKLIPTMMSDTPGSMSDGRHKLAEIRALPGVRAALGVTTWTMERERDGPRRHDEAKELIATMGVDGDPSEIPGALALLEGRWLRRSNEVVLGKKLSHEKGLGIGDTIRLNARDFTVVGIGRLRGFGFNLDSIAYLDDRAFRDRADLGDVYNIIAVETAQPEQTRQRIADLGSFTMSTAGELIKEAEETLAAELITYYVLDGLALAIGALFVSSMLSHAVSERRLEFATLRAIGIPTRTILLTVAAEATAVSIVAGVVGVGLSLLLGSWVNDYLAPSHDLEFLYSADARLFAQVFVLALALGLIAGLLPARAATRVDPVDVLREA